MSRPRTIGVWPQDDGSLVIVYPSQEARDGFKTITIPAAAVAVLRQNWGIVIETPEKQLEVPTTTPQQQARTDLALAVIIERPGMRGGAVCSEVLYRMGEDEENQKLRNRTLGFLNELHERGLVIRDDEDRFWPVESGQKASDG